eukprot:11131285-Karenia_brevis.AAC.1
MQRRMLNVLSPVERKTDDETIGQYINRRHLHTKSLASKMGKFSEIWATSCKNWYEHLARRPANWWGRVLLAHNPWQFLALKRIWNNSKTWWAGRTNTRAVRFVAPRWEESLLNHLPYEEQVNVGWKREPK